MQILVIYSHSYPEQSVSGKAILEVYAADPRVKLRNLDELYPEGTPIDVEAEQQALREADVIIVQHPLFWFNVPSRLKRWMDDVLQYGFAYGSTGTALHGKKFVHSFTTGSGADTYAGELLEVCVAPLRVSAGFCGMEYVGAFPLFGQNAMSNPEAGPRAAAHVRELLARL